MSKTEGEAQGYNLNKIQKIKRTRRQILASDPAKAIGASSRIDSLASWFETVGPALRTGLRVAQNEMQVRPAESKPDLEKKDSVEEDTFANPDSIFHYAGKVVVSIKDPQIKGDAVEAIVAAETKVGRSALHDKFKPRFFSTDPHEWETFSRIMRSQGRYSVALYNHERAVELLDGKDNPDWYLDTAVHKGQNGKAYPSDSSTGSVGDLVKAELMFFPTGKKLGAPDIINLVKVSIARKKIFGYDSHWDLTGIELHFDDFAHLLTGNTGNRDFLADFLQEADALAAGYSEIGRFTKAFNTLERIPTEKQPIEVWDTKIKGLQRIINDYLENFQQEIATDRLRQVMEGRGPSVDLTEKITRADQAAGYTLNALLDMPDGSEKDILLATVGVDLNVVRAMASSQQETFTLEPRQQTLPSGIYMNRALKIQEGIADPALYAESRMISGNRSWFYLGWNYADSSVAFQHLADAQDTGRLVGQASIDRAMGVYKAVIRFELERTHGTTNSDFVRQVLEKMKLLATTDATKSHYAQSLADYAAYKSITDS